MSLSARPAKRVAMSTGLRRDLVAFPGLSGRPVVPAAVSELPKGSLFFAASSYVIVNSGGGGAPPRWAEARLLQLAGGGDVPVRTIGASGDSSPERR